MRIKGTELEKYAKSKGRGRKAVGRGAEGKGRSHGNSSRSFDETPVNVGGRAKPSKWRQQSSQFRDAIRQVKYSSQATVVSHCKPMFFFFQGSSKIRTMNTVNSRRDLILGNAGSYVFLGHCRVEVLHALFSAWRRYHICHGQSGKMP